MEISPGHPTDPRRPTGPRRSTGRERGLATIEYAIAGTLAAIALTFAFTDLGTAVSDRITAMTTVIS